MRKVFGWFVAKYMAQHSILVGVDGSEAAADAVRWAVGAMHEDDTLCLVTVGNYVRPQSVSSCCQAQGVP